MIVADPNKAASKHQRARWGKPKEQFENYHSNESGTQKTQLSSDYVRQWNRAYENPKI